MCECNKEEEKKDVIDARTKLKLQLRRDIIDMTNAYTDLLNSDCDISIEGFSERSAVLDSMALLIQEMIVNAATLTPTQLGFIKQHDKEQIEESTKEDCFCNKPD